MAQTAGEWRLLVQDLKGRNHILPIFLPRRLVSKLVRVTFKMHTVSQSQCAVQRQKRSFITHLVRICKHRCMTTTSLKWGAETVVNKHREGKKVNIWAKLGPSCAETGKEHNTWRQPRAKAKVLFVHRMSQTENLCSFFLLCRFQVLCITLVWNLSTIKWVDLMFMRASCKSPNIFLCQ